LDCFIKLFCADFKNKTNRTRSSVIKKGTSFTLKAFFLFYSILHLNFKTCFKIVFDQMVKIEIWTHAAVPRICGFCGVKL